MPVRSLSVRLKIQPPAVGRFYNITNEIKDRLRGTKVQKKVALRFYNTLLSLSDYFLNIVKSNAPIGDRDEWETRKRLVNTLKMAYGRTTQFGRESIFLGVTSAAPHFPSIVSGSSPHPIYPRNPMYGFYRGRVILLNPLLFTLTRATPLKSGRIAFANELIAVESVNHPGYKPNKFIDKSFLQMRNIIDAAFTNAVERAGR